MTLTKIGKAFHSPEFHLLMTFIWAIGGSGITLWLMRNASAMEVWIALISVYANVVGHWGGYQSGRAEMEAKKKK